VAPVIVNASTYFSYPYDYTINDDNTVTLLRYNGPGGDVVIPDILANLPVTIIGDNAFSACGSLTSVAIGTNVTQIGFAAFRSCGLTNAIIPSSVTYIGDEAFASCGYLTNVTLPNSIKSIGEGTFAECAITNVIIPNSVESIGSGAFSYMSKIGYGGGGSLVSVTIGTNVSTIGDSVFGGSGNLKTVYFQGDAPISVGSMLFSGTPTIYYLQGTTGWSGNASFAGCPLVLWNPSATNDANFGIQSGKFGFTVTGTPNICCVVECCTNLANPVWSAMTNLTLTTGSSYFSDPQWTNRPASFYRFRAP
jgi:hypothetical protein